MTRRNIASQGTSRASGCPSQAVRRRLLVGAIAPLFLLGACSEPTAPAPSATSRAVSTSPNEDVASGESTTLRPTTTSVVSTTVSVASETASTSLAQSSSSVSRSRPSLIVSQSDDLDPAGTLVTVSGRGFDTTKGIYVFVCNQARWDANRRCVGGINLDGSSPLSQWISSNPPGYAKGLTVRFEAGGSFSVPLLVRAIDETTNLIDCRVEQCGVVAFADHTRRDDRSQDVFVPITFSSGN